MRSARGERRSTVTQRRRSRRGSQSATTAKRGGTPRTRSGIGSSQRSAHSMSRSRSRRGRCQPCHLPSPPAPKARSPRRAAVSGEETRSNSRDGRAAHGEGAGGRAVLSLGSSPRGSTRPQRLSTSTRRPSGAASRHARRAAAGSGRVQSRCLSMMASKPCGGLSADPTTISTFSPSFRAASRGLRASSGRCPVR